MLQLFVLSRVMIYCFCLKFKLVRCQLFDYLLTVSVKSGLETKFAVIDYTWSGTWKLYIIFFLSSYYYWGYDNSTIITTVVFTQSKHILI